MKTPSPKNTLLRAIHATRTKIWQWRMRVPARYAVHVVILVVAGVVAMQNVRATTPEAAFKNYDRLDRYFNIAEGELITETAERGTSDQESNDYLSAGIELPSLALGGDLDTIALLSNDRDIAITATTALADQSISLTKIAERPREEIIGYTIQGGDTISSIATDFDISVATLMWENDLLESTILKPGANLRILPVDGLTHKVKDGDTLTSIAKKYQASVTKIMSFNKLASESAIKIDQTLIVPGGKRPAPPKPAPSPRPIVAAANTNSGFGNVIETIGSTTATGSFVWPTSCHTVTQGFGWHQGIDIACPFGSPLYAADGGSVVEAGWNGGGYGYNIIVDHGTGCKTRYAHIAQGGIHVSTGQGVARGQHIADMGSTGNSTGPHIHFEVICGGAVQNPYNYL